MSTQAKRNDTIYSLSTSTIDFDSDINQMKTKDFLPVEEVQVKLQHLMKNVLKNYKILEQIFLI